MKAMDTTNPPLTRPPNFLWMLEPPTRLIDKRTSLCLNLPHNKNVARNLNKAVRRSLLVESRRRMDTAAEEIGACLEPEMVKTDLKGAYKVLKR